MGVYEKRDSKFYWCHLEGQVGPGARRRLDILVAAPTAAQRKQQRADAQAIYVQQMAALGKGQHGLAVTARPAITFPAYARWYLEHHTAQKRGVRRERSKVNHWIDLLHGEWLHAIDASRLIEARTTRLKQGVGAATVNRELSILSNIFKTAIPKYLTANPLTGVPELYTEGIGIRLLSVEEEARLFAQPMNPETRAVILLGLDCFLRLADVAHLKRDQFHGDRLQIIKPKVTPYWVPVSRRLRAALEAVPRQGPHPYFFPGRWPHRRPVPIDVDTAADWFLWACERAGLPTHREHDGLTFHCLRHTAATRALNAGVNPRAVMVMGGWKSLKQLERYGHSSDHELRRASAAISGESVQDLRQWRDHAAS